MCYRIIFTCFFTIISSSIFGQGIPQLLTQSILTVDSVELATDIYLPSSEGSFPTILFITPIDRRDKDQQQFCQFLVNRGFAVVIQNPRGKFGSGGSFQAFTKNTDDLEQTLEWTLAQNWCNDQIGLYGNALSSYYAQQLASLQHPALKALVVHSGISRTDEFLFPGGSFRLDTAYPLLNEIKDKDSLSNSELENLFTEWPLAGKMDWKAYSLFQMAQASVLTHKIKTPTLHINGWNDWTYRQTFFLYNDIKKFNASVPQHMVLGPWEHQHEPASAMVGPIDFGNESLMSATAFQRKVANWLEYYVSGKPIPVPTRHEFFMMGLNKWIDIPHFPPEESKSLQFYLQKDTLLGPEPPEEELTYEYDYDPENPTPSLGGVNSHYFPDRNGPMDQSLSLEREDVLTFESDTLSENLYIFGAIKTVLFVSSDVPDTDFCAKLLVKRENGQYRIIEDGIIRAANRNTRLSKEWLEKEKTYRLEIDLGYSAIEIKAGEQLVLQISSSNFPKYNVNHNVKVNSLETTKLQKAHQTIHAGGENASFLSVTTVPETFVQQYLQVN